MIRFFVSVAVRLLANALGLIAADVILDDLSLTARGFILDVAIFTGLEIIARPILQKTALKHSEALMGSTALLSSLVALILTAWLSDGLRISGAVTWVLATIIIWAVALVAGILLPVLVFKRWLRANRSDV